jgi:nucleoside-diphosphate-sugar epimerase
MADCVLVTGGTGFLGQRLVRALREREFRVRVLVRPRSLGRAPAQRLRALDAELVPGNMLDRSSLRSALPGVTRVFHLAGRLFVPGVPDSDYEQLHIEGTLNLLTACAEMESPPAILHCSTTGVLGPTGPTPVSENTPLKPSNVYERTKAVSEQLALALARRCGLRLTVARPALVYGPGDLHLLGWFRAIRWGYYRVVGSGDNLLHPIYVDDVAEGLIRCAETPAAGRLYHLVGERALPIRELAEAMARALSRRLSRLHLPVSLALGVAAVLESLPGIAPDRLPLTRSRIAFMTQSRAYCGECARRELNFTPRIDLETGLRRTVAWYDAEGLL